MAQVHPSVVQLKGALEEVLSKARYSDDPSKYTVRYRDKEEFPEVSLVDFINTFDEEGEPIDIPIHRIVLVSHNGEIVWQKQGFEDDI